MNEFNLPKEYKWEQLHTKIDGVKYIQAETAAQTTSYLAQVPPVPGIMLLGFGALNVLEIHVSQYDITSAAIVWTQVI
jgi:hypothetical protein